MSISSEASWNDAEFSYQSGDEQPLQSGVLSWLASKSKLREKKKTENPDTKMSSHQEEKDRDELSTMLVYPSSLSINENSGFVDAVNEKVSHNAASPPEEFLGSELIVHTVDGDVMDYIREFRSDLGEEEETIIEEGVWSPEEEEGNSDSGDTAQSSLQVRY